jgi:hypothetical protein
LIKYLDDVRHRGVGKPVIGRAVGWSGRCQSGCAAHVPLNEIQFCEQPGLGVDVDPAFLKKLRKV